MTTRTYRVIATGQFSGLSPELKQRLRDEQAEHDMFESAFTAEGTFTYTPSLTRFTLGYLLEVSETSAAEADVAAGVEAELLAEAFLAERGIAHKPLAMSATCLEDVKVKRRR